MRGPVAGRVYDDEYLLSQTENCRWIKTAEGGSRVILQVDEPLKFRVCNKMQYAVVDTARDEDVCWQIVSNLRNFYASWGAGKSAPVAGMHTRKICASDIAPAGDFGSWSEPQKIVLDGGGHGTLEVSYKVREKPFWMVRPSVWNRYRAELMNR